MDEILSKSQDVWIIPLQTAGSIDKVFSILEDGDVVLYSVIFIHKERICRSTFSRDELRILK